MLSEGQADRLRMMKKHCGAVIGSIKREVLLAVSPQYDGLDAIPTSLEFTIAD